MQSFFSKSLSRSAKFSKTFERDIFFSDKAYRIRNTRGELCYKMIKVSFLLCFTLLAISKALKNVTSGCNLGDKSIFYLDAATEMIEKAKVHFPECSAITSKPTDCGEFLRRDGKKKSGVYTIWPKSRVIENKPIDVFCDMDTDGGGWTVIQRRGTYGRPNDYFFKDWNDYKIGFGDIEKDFWLGNDNIFALTNQRLYSIRFDLMAVGGEKRYAIYDTFWIDDENNDYTLHIKDYSGDAGDSMTGSHNNKKFSTKDRDNDSYEGQCAVTYKGAWWYSSCHSSNLNGLYLRGIHERHSKGVHWYSFKDHNESLDTTEMKIRPKNFRKTQLLIETPQS
ncbi:techylectin-5A [Trichonephila clavata]|uniref:Techylectin-5A n=1 Tax=Trichonephila clavata TaxID=2740835 RepID=A0A8X6FU52_TRICU|nr:techylectin-5A [Trichonephila clavata]